MPAQRPASDTAAHGLAAAPDLLAATAASQQALTGKNDRDAVVWLSEHIATLDRVAHAPRSGAAGRLAYRVTAWADHVLDVLDSRTVRPVPAIVGTQAA